MPLPPVHAPAPLHVRPLSHPFSPPTHVSAARMSASPSPPSDFAPTETHVSNYRPRHMHPSRHDSRVGCPDERLAVLHVDGDGDGLQDLREAGDSGAISVLALRSSRADTKGQGRRRHKRNHRPGAALKPRAAERVRHQRMRWRGHGSPLLSWGHLGSFTGINHRAARPPLDRARLPLGRPSCGAAQPQPLPPPTADASAGEQAPSEQHPSRYDAILSRCKGHREVTAPKR